MKPRRPSGTAVAAAMLVGLALAMAPADLDARSGAERVVPLEWLAGAISVDRAEAEHPGIGDEPSTGASGAIAAGTPRPPARSRPA